MRYTHILWDFNGTILDDVQTGIDCVNRLLIPRGLPPIADKSHYRALFGFPVKDYYARLGFDFEKESFADLAIEWMTLYKRHCPDAPLVPGVIQAFEYFQSAGAVQTVLSATEIGILNEQLRSLGIFHYFHETIGLDNIHAGSKTHLAVEWQERTKPERVLMIGDTVHDYDTARAIGADCVLYTGGHSEKSALEACRCPLFDSYEELLERLSADRLE